MRVPVGVILVAALAFAPAPLVAPIAVPRPAVNATGGGVAPDAVAGHARSVRAAAKTAPLTSADALARAFAAGHGTVALGTDISTDSLALPAGGELTLDLAGHALAVDHGGGFGAAIEVPTGSALTITDSSADHSGTLTASATHGAGIGGGHNGDASAGSITIAGGTVTASSEDGAGIGGGASYGTADGGTITISGGTVTAYGGAAAGIGGGNGGHSADGGTVRITGGTVTAASHGGGAGIGGGSSPRESNGGTVTISGGTIHATGSHGAGIGGGASGDTANGGKVTISGGTVTAVGVGGAGIGGGESSGSGTADGAAVTVGADATLTVSADTNALGPGAGEASAPGSFANAGMTTVQGGTAALADAHNTGTVMNHGAIRVTGTLHNDGTILGEPPTPVAKVVGNNYTVTTADGTPLHLLAASARDAKISLPEPASPPPTGSRFAGWSATAGDASAVVDVDTSLRKAFGAGPLEITLGHPVWKAIPRPAPPAPPDRTVLVVAGIAAGAGVLVGVLALVIGPLLRGRRRRRAGLARHT